jgi:TolB-like protein/Tfp pilus assembly protein PilF
MSSDAPSDLKIEIAHVLTMDVVEYSTLLITEQSRVMAELTRIVQNTARFRRAEAEKKLLRLPTGDGMALVFFHDPEAPIECAMEISAAMKNHPDIRLRMGIHSGPINQIVDVNNRSNIAGAGIDIAQRVMDCGDSGHILLSKRVAEDLAPFPRWNPHLHDLGECEVKHGRKVSLVNFYTNEIGNPESPKKYAAATEKPSARSTSSFGEIFQKRALVTTAALLIVAAVIGLWIFSRQTTSRPGTKNVASAPQTNGKSIAVLPFENLSEEKANAFFAQGIQDEILTALSKISGLKVISRTSTAHLKSAPANLPEIARQLDVANFLEGSIQKAGDRVHINVQLIQAENGGHLWAQSYDRTLTDIFAVEGEVARSVADSLKTALTPQELERVETKPTTNSDAYVLYLRAVEIAHRAVTLDDANATAKLLQEAIALDPNFALAHARLSRTYGLIGHFVEPTQSRRDQALAEAEEALRLQPDLGEAHQALALCHYWGRHDYPAALAELAIAKKTLPNDAWNSLIEGAIARRQGRLKQAIEAFQRALTFDPRSIDAAHDIEQTYAYLRDWPAAIQANKQMLAVLEGQSPERVLSEKINGAFLAFYQTGSTKPIRALLEQCPADLDPNGVVTFVGWDLALLERDFAAAERAITQARMDPLPTVEGPLSKDELRGFMQRARGDSAVAVRASFDAGRRKREGEIQLYPEDASRHAILGMIYSCAGQKEDAIREGRRAVELKPESGDPIEGPQMQAALALIYAQVGETDRAITLLEHLLTVPGPVNESIVSITLSDLRLRWEWDPLRHDPRFQKLLSGPEPKTIYK